MMQFSDKTLALAQQAEQDLVPVFARVDRIAQHNTEKVLAAFHRARVSDTHFIGTTGYGYDDRGRDTLDRIYADVFHCEDALVRIGFVNGTHALTAALFGMLRPGDVLLSVMGAPYDTLQSAIGISGDEPGNLRQFGVGYRQVDPTAEGEPDYDAIAEAVRAADVKTVLIQRSRGYSTRAALNIDRIRRIVDTVRAVNETVHIMVDNCYGEFVEELEPTDVGADLIVGSLIKNPGGGLCLTGGYIAGKKDLVEAAAMRLTSPGIGRECGCTLDQNRSLYQGFFMAPHTTAQAVKTAAFCARMMELLGYKSSPASDSVRTDIVQTIEFGNPEGLCKFCRGIQAGAPVDSFVTPEPWDMPGYADPVIMAAGAFVQGASIELSADGPMRPPYLAYMQGGLTYESGKVGILLAVEELMKE
jgi:cystathionine beta-lyase family protein involved in aluminum resistance